MPDYIQSSDLELLRSVGFTVGFSGDSWFGKDLNGKDYWQAYIADWTDRMVFVNQEDRVSTYLTRQEFKEKFGG